MQTVLQVQHCLRMLQLVILTATQFSHREVECSEITKSIT